MPVALTPTRHHPHINFGFFSSFLYCTIWPDLKRPRADTARSANFSMNEKLAQQSWTKFINGFGKKESTVARPWLNVLIQFPRIVISQLVGLLFACVLVLSFGVFAWRRNNSVNSILFFPGFSFVWVADIADSLDVVKTNKNGSSLFVRALTRSSSISANDIYFVVYLNWRPHHFDHFHLLKICVRHRKRRVSGAVLSYFVFNAQSFIRRLLLFSKFISLLVWHEAKRFNSEFILFFSSFVQMWMCVRRTQCFGLGFSWQFHNGQPEHVSSVCVPLNERGMLMH